MKTNSKEFKKFRARVICTLARYCDKLGDMDINMWLNIAEPCFKSVSNVWFADVVSVFAHFEATGRAIKVRGPYNIYYLPIWRKKFQLAK